MKELEVAQSNLSQVQQKMKRSYNQKTKFRSFAHGDEVLMLLPLQGQSLVARYSCPYVVERRVGDLNYMVASTDRCKRAQLCHMNML